MKPRLETAPLTNEDFDIWDFICSPYRLVPRTPMWSYILADRRDADLMLVLYQAWHQSAVPLVKNTALATVGLNSIEQLYV